MIQSEVAITTNQDVDEERVNYIKKIKLETSFYNVFRNTIRVLINNYEYSKIRVKIENELLKEYLIYSEKLKNVDRLLRELVKDKIQFIGDQNYYKLINEVSTCVVKNKDKCASSPNLCVVTENGSCNLILPEKNLITNKVNEPIYYGRMADELIRYNRIKSFMLQPQTYLSFNNIGYNLRDNELILIQSLLTKEYFETLKPTVTNKYIKQMSYDEVNPIISQMYENKFPLVDNSIIGKNNKNEKNDNDKNEKVVKCIKFKPHIQSTAWNSCFPDNYGEIVYGNTNYCTINFIIDLIERKTGEKLTVNGVKNVLFEEYKKYLDKYIEKIVDILILEGKKTLGDQVSGGIISFSNLIHTDNYFFTTFDLWLLVTKYEIPTVFISPHYILQTKYSKRAFIAYGERNDQFAFIIIPGFSAEKIPTFKLITSSEKEAFISIDKLSGECLDSIQEALNNKETIESYLEKFTKPNTRKKKPLPFIIADDSEEVQEKAVPVEENVVEENVVGEKAAEENVVGEKANSGKTKKNKKNNMPAKPRTKKNKPLPFIVENGLEEIQEKAVVENVVGENVVGENVVGENVVPVGENVVGEKANSGKTKKNKKNNMPAKPRTKKNKPLPFIVENGLEEVQEKAVVENVVGENVVGENVVGENVVPVEENVVGENVVGEKANSGKTKKNKKNNMPAKPRTKKNKPLPFIVENGLEEVPEKAVGENVVGENVVGENVVGENVVGENVVGENVVGENVVGENVVGEKALE